MTRQTLIRFSLGLLAASITVGVFGQTEDIRLPAPEKNPEMLQVELLLFKHERSDDHAQSLYDIQDLPLSPLPEAQTILTPDDTRGSDFGEIYAVFSDKHRLLLKEAQKMRAGKRIQFLHHIAWLQPLPKDGDAPYVRLLAEQSRGVLDGVARVTPEKYNRIEVLLRYDLDSNKIMETPCAGDAGAIQCVEPSSPTASSRIPPSSRVLHIHLTGLTPNDQLLYLDHPILAALVAVTRTTRQPPDAAPIYPTPSTPTTWEPARSSPTQIVE